MALSKDDLSKIKSMLNRAPSTVEEVVFDTMWSEHCSYKSSKPVLKTLPTEGSEVVLGVGEDSGIVYFDTFDGKRYCIAASHESHNHPSQILPVEGAATGVGGVVRDVYCMGADVIGVLDSLHFGIPQGEMDVVSDIAERVVFGVSDYGNPLGVPVLGGETIYHPSYNENCLVNVAALGLVQEDRIIRSRVPKEAADEPYDVILFGKSTDSTGFGGASFSSTILDEEDELTNMGAVQVHDPFLKRVLVNAIMALLDLAHSKRIPIGMKDLGAGGISCAASELAVAGGFGIRLDLDKVNVAMDGLPPEVIACSETQERFCLAVPRSFSEEVLSLFNDTFELPQIYHKAGACVVGEIIPEKQFVIVHKGETVCDLPVACITTEVRAPRTAEPRPIPEGTESTLHLSTERLKEITATLLASRNNASKRYVYRFFDNAVRGDTVVYPGEADAVVVTPVEGCDTALAVSMDSNTYGLADPYTSGAYAVAESIRNVIAVGAKPIAITDCLNYGNPEQPSVFFDFEEGVRGIGDAANALSFIPNEPVPIISGNVSFYNESKTGNAIVPSPVIMTMGRMTNYQTALTMHITQDDHHLVLIGNRRAEFEATELSELLTDSEKAVGLGSVPKVRLEEESKQNKAVYNWIQNGQLHACHDISKGGLWQTLLEMLLGERGGYKVGARLQCPQAHSIEACLFSENGGYLLAVSSDHIKAIESSCVEWGIDHLLLGNTTSSPILHIQHGESTLLEHSLLDLKTHWNAANLSALGTRV